MRDALAEAESFARARPPDEIGCLYYATKTSAFVMPSTHLSLGEQGIVLHVGSPGGVLPKIADARVEGLAEPRASGGA